MFQEQGANELTVDHSSPSSTPDRNDDRNLEPIAIIGIGCRLPGDAHSPESFWRMLCQGVDAISEVPSDRWSIKRFYDADSSKPNKTLSRWGGFVNQPIELFDAAFFGMSPREAAYLDPMQRWLMEVTLEAFEDAGLVPQEIEGSPTGVYIGEFTSDFQLLRLSEKNRHTLGPHAGTGYSMTMLANRLSYTYDLRGPSIAIDTACSSSLVAVHMACQSLREGETSLAIAGGANAMFRPEHTISEAKAGMLSPDGRCKAFDSRANGYVRSEGAAVVVLKRLSEALADGNQIYAVIRATGVNQDGHTQGITVPSGQAQAALAEEVCRRAGVVPGEIQYVEAHGTGTPVGDPIEVNALASVLKIGRPEDNKCIISSVKTNIGHTEAVAGVVGLIKTALCLKHQAIPAHLHFQQANPQIPFDSLCLRLPHGLEAWPEHTGPALACVNSFGFGGTNAHAVLEEAPRAARTSDDPTPQTEALLALSAQTPQALSALARSYRDLLQDAANQPDLSFHDICYAAAARRTQHQYRLALVADSHDAGVRSLDAFLADEALSGLSVSQKRADEAPKIAFVFSGMGPQWWGMGRELIEREPVFRAVIKQCDALLRQYADWSLLEEMLADEGQSRMAETRISQPANFALQVALYELWRSWGVEPSAIVGHSAGEVAAAYIAGALSLDDAIRVIYHRSRLQHLTTGQGKLVAIGLPLAEARQAITGHEDRISIAAVNSPSSVTLVGDPAALEIVTQALEARQVFVRYLRGDVPYHSHYMEPLKAELLETLQSIQPRPATMPLFSTVTGAQSIGTEWDALYWWQNVRAPVLFAAATNDLIAAGYTTFLELAPHPVLANSIKECLSLQQQQGTVVASLRRQMPERAQLLETLGSLYVAGYPLQAQGCAQGRGRFVKLPTYPWQREVHWSEAEEARLDRLGQECHPLLGERVRSASPTWENTLDLDILPYLADHQLQRAVVYPGAGYIEMGLSAVRELFGGATTLEVTDIEFRKALFIPSGVRPATQLTLDAQTGAYGIYSQVDTSSQSWTLHATGTVAPAQSRSGRRIALDQLRQRCREQVGSDVCYAHFRNLGLEYGPSFQGIRQLWRGDDEILAQMQLPPEIVAQFGEYHTHPVVIDVCFQTLLATTLPADLDIHRAEPNLYLPIAIDRCRLAGTLPEQMWISARLRRVSSEELYGDILLLDEAGNVFVEIQGMHAQSMQTSRDTSAADFQNMLYQLEWQQQADLPIEADTARHDQPGTWLVFRDRTGAGEELVKLLDAHGETCVSVFPGDDYAISLAERECRLNPQQRQHFDRLIADLRSSDFPLCRGIVHLWGLDAGVAEPASVAALEHAQSLGLGTLLHIAQACTSVLWSTTPRLWVATRGVHAIGAEPEQVAVAQSPLWGFGRVIGHHEGIDLWGGLVDLDPSGTAADAALLFAELWNNEQSDQVAFRQGRRYLPRIARYEDGVTWNVSPRFSADASYLITGGLGGLGLEVARWMAAQGARRLILMGRTPLPQRSTWNKLPADSAQARQVAAIRELEALGVTVHPAAVDVTSEEQLTAFLERYREEGWPPIRGVIHAAGTSQPQLIPQMTYESMTQVLQPKVYGAWLLHRCLADEPLEFFVLFSSIASLGFSSGQGAYAAGNAFLDALAQARRSQGLPALSINWGAWGEVGMASQSETLAYFERRGVRAISRTQGIQLLARIFRADQPQISAVAVNWSLLAQNNYPMGIVPAMLTDMIAEAEAELPVESAATDQDISILEELQQLEEPSEQVARLEEHLLGLVARVLRMSRSQLASNVPLNALGLDSMMAIELKNYIDADLSVSVSVMTLLQGVSIAEIARLLQPELPAQSSENFDDLLADLERLSADDLQMLLDENLSSSI